MKTIKGTPVTDGEYRFCELVKSRKHFTTADAQELYGTGRQNISRIISQLRAKGLIKNISGTLYRVVK